MKYKTLLFTKTDGIATITLNSPKNLNAMSEDLLQDLNGALIVCTNDATIKAVIIKGEGRAFCAGGDIFAMKRGVEENDTETLVRMVISGGDVARRIRHLRKPVIAAVHGSAAGGGSSLALLCDFRVVTEDVRFIESFVNIGLVPDVGGVYILSRYLGLGRLTDYLMTGRHFTAQEALEMGIVNIVTTKENLEAEALTLAQYLLSKPALSIARIKAMINQTLFVEMDLCLDREVEYQSFLANTQDYAEGVTAFMEKRKANFQGK